MDIQQILANATKPASSTALSPSSGQPANTQARGEGSGIFAHHMALASLRPDADASAGQQDDSPRGVLGGINGEWTSGPFTSDPSATSLSALSMDANAQGIADEELLGDLTQQLPPEALEALLARLSEALSPEDSARLLAELNAQLAAPERDALLGELMASLPVDEQQALLDRMLGSLTVDEQQALLSQLTDAQIIDQTSTGESGMLLTQLGADQRQALLDELIGRLTHEQRAALLADWGQRVTAPERGALLTQLTNQIPMSQLEAVLGDWRQSLSSDLRLGLPSELPAGLAAQMRGSGWSPNGAFLSQPGAEPQAGALLSGLASLADQLRMDGRGTLASLATDQRATVSSEFSRAMLELVGSPGQASRDTLAPSLRELLGLNLITREGVTPELARSMGNADANISGLGMTNNGLASYGAIAGGQGGMVSTGAAINAPLYSPAWPQQLGQQLLILSQRGGDQQVELRLNPPDLGPLTVSLKIGEQGTQIQFLAANALVRGAVEQAIPQLREALAEQGINLGETSVGEQRQGDEQGFAEGNSGQQTDGAGSLAGSSDTAATGLSTRIEIGLDGRVDIYA